MASSHSDKRFVTIDGKTHEVELPAELDFPTTILLDGAQHRVDLLQRSATEWSLQIDDDRQPVTMHHAADSLSIHTGGWEYEAKVENERTRRLKEMLVKESGGGGPLIFKAPMPGLVLKLLKQNGDVVKNGEPLAILEAMKMENELRSNVTGVVLEYHVKAGQTVEKGAPLLTIHREDA